MIAWRLIMLATAAAAAAAPVPPGIFSDASPPMQFRGDASVGVSFVGDVDSATACGNAGHDHHFVACTRNGVMVLPNPCSFDDEYFAHLACHELAHRNGWAADHPGAIPWPKAGD